MNLRDSIALRALDFDGTSYGNSATREEYCRLLFPADTRQNASSMASSMSSCLLFLRGLLALEDGVDGTILYRGKSTDVIRAPYASYVGQIDEMLWAFAKARGAFVSGSDPRMIELVKIPGTMVEIGYGGSLPKDEAAKAKHLAQWGGIAHGLVITAFDEGESTVDDVSGGKLDASTGRSTAIKKETHKISFQKDGIWVGARKVNWGFDTDALGVASASSRYPDGAKEPLWPKLLVGGSAIAMLVELFRRWRGLGCAFSQCALIFGVEENTKRTRADLESVSSVGDRFLFGVSDQFSD